MSSNSNSYSSQLITSHDVIDNPEPIKVSSLISTHHFRNYALFHDKLILSKVDNPQKIETNTDGLPMNFPTTISELVNLPNNEVNAQYDLLKIYERCSPADRKRKFARF
ncbi:hypothetical protein RIR_jg1323.t1 [Rhizophagus irregularis DAOM 181602=DAOM 197198]|nr:hypothetical protein RIR_jg1323.t1 [Rhizophagus irregularis DAOM 181602=DAOM 197198]